MYLLIKELDRNSPALDTSIFTAVDEDNTGAMQNYETSTYFCQGGHVFLLAFEEGVKPTRYFECVTCTALATDETPEETNTQPTSVVQSLYQYV